MANILIVDDSRTSRKVLRNVLEAAGYTVVGEAKNGQEGVDLYKQLKPDLVTMDITMPVLSGIDALRCIKVYDPDAKVVMVTSSGQDHKVVEAIKLGAEDFLPKPYEPTAVDEMVKRVLK